MPISRSRLSVRRMAQRGTARDARPSAAGPVRRTRLGGTSCSTRFSALPRRSPRLRQLRCVRCARCTAGRRIGRRSRRGHDRPRARIIHSFDGPISLGQERLPERGGGDASDPPTAKGGLGPGCRADFKPGRTKPVCSLVLPPRGWASRIRCRAGAVRSCVCLGEAAERDRRDQCGLSGQTGSV